MTPKKDNETKFCMAHGLVIDRSRLPLGVLAPTGTYFTRRWMPGNPLAVE